jgi:hypothetical protein
MHEQHHIIHKCIRGPDEFITVGTTKFDAFVVENKGCVGVIWDES